MPKDLKTRGSVGFKNTSGDKECQLPLVSRLSSQTVLPSAKMPVCGNLGVPGTGEGRIIAKVKELFLSSFTFK